MIYGDWIKGNTPLTIRTREEIRSFTFITI